MVVGVKILIIIALMGGLIAYMGDKLGTKVGKRRMSLFGLRPKHTSIIVTIVTGLLVAAATVGVLSFTSQSVRTALFGMDQLRADMKHLNEEVAAKTQELIRGKALLEQNKQELEERMAEIEQIRREVEATKAKHNKKKPKKLNQDSAKKDKESKINEQPKQPKQEENVQEEPKQKTLKDLKKLQYIGNMKISVGRGKKSNLTKLAEEKEEVIELPKVPDGLLDDIITSTTEASEKFSKLVEDLKERSLLEEGGR